MACNSDDDGPCGSSGSGPDSYRINSITAMAGSYDSTEYGNFSPKLSQNYLSARMAIYPTSYLPSEIVKFETPSHNLFISKAFACTPVPPSTANKVKELTITSSGPINVNDTTYKTGEVINKLFKVTYSYWYLDEKEADLDSLVQASISRPFYLIEYDGILVLALKDSAKIINQDINIHIEFDDGLVEEILINNFDITE